MKSTVLSRLVLAPIQWLRKIRGFRLVYTPLLAIVLFTAVMGIILGTLHLQEKGQQEAALFRELASAKQRIQLRFANNSESLNREIAASSEDPKLKQLVHEQSNDLVQNNQEIIKVVWLDANSSRVWSVPTNIQKSEWDAQLEKILWRRKASTTIELNRVTGRTAFSKFVILNMPGEPSKEKRTLFWQVTSNIVGGEAIGFLATLYTTQGILILFPGNSKPFIVSHS